MGSYLSKASGVSTCLAYRFVCSEMRDNKEEVKKRRKISRELCDKKTVGPHGTLQGTINIEDVSDFQFGKVDASSVSIASCTCTSL